MIRDRISDSELAGIEDQVERGALPLWVWNDAFLHDLEMQRIFGSAWVFLAHETEIRSPGDYVARDIGKDPFIVVRGEDGTIRVLFDSCRHRGARVCHADKGNADSFVCPYHGWTYKNTGELTGVPNLRNAFRGLDVTQWGLNAAPRVEIYRGLIFASLDPKAVPLADFLGDFRWYFDMHLAICPEGMEVVGLPHRWKIDADWKAGADNFCGDSYHTQTLHRSIIRMGLASDRAAGAAGNKNDVHINECSGHSTSIRRLDAGSTYFWGYPESVHQTFSSRDLTPEQFDIARRSVVHTGNIFPNLSLIHLAAKDAPDGEAAAFFSLRQWKPRGPGTMEAWSWVLVPKSASQEYKAQAYRAAVASFSPSGSFEQDDSSVWVGICRAARSEFARKQQIALNLQMGLPGCGEANVLSDWPGPGTAYDTNLEEGGQRTFWRHWSRAISGKTDVR